jgi:hypothetical protein
MRPTFSEAIGEGPGLARTRGIHQRRDPRNYRLTRGTPSERR